MDAQAHPSRLANLKGIFHLAVSVIVDKTVGDGQSQGWVTNSGARRATPLPPSENMAHDWHQIRTLVCLSPTEGRPWKLSDEQVPVMRHTYPLWRRERLFGAGDCHSNGGRCPCAVAAYPASIPSPRHQFQSDGSGFPASRQQGILTPFNMDRRGHQRIRAEHFYTRWWCIQNEKPAPLEFPDGKAWGRQLGINTALDGIFSYR